VVFCQGSRLRKLVNANYLEVGKRPVVIRSLEGMGGRQLCLRSCEERHDLVKEIM
jgi:hypothetical protein